MKEIDIRLINAALRDQHLDATDLLKANDGQSKKKVLCRSQILT